MSLLIRLNHWIILHSAAWTPKGNWLRFWSNAAINLPPFRKGGCVALLLGGHISGRQEPRPSRSLGAPHWVQAHGLFPAGHHPGEVRAPHEKPRHHPSGCHKVPGKGDTITWRARKWIRDPRHCKHKPRTKSSPILSSPGKSSSVWRTALLAYSKYPLFTGLRMRKLGKCGLMARSFTQLD